MFSPQNSPLEKETLKVVILFCRILIMKITTEARRHGGRQEDRKARKLTADN